MKFKAKLEATPISTRVPIIVLIEDSSKQAQQYSYFHERVVFCAKLNYDGIQRCTALRWYVFLCGTLLGL